MRIQWIIQGPGSTTSSKPLRLFQHFQVFPWFSRDFPIGDNRMMAYAKSMRYSIIVAEKNTMYKFQGAPMYMIFLGNVFFFPWSRLKSVCQDVRPEQVEHRTELQKQICQAPWLFEICRAENMLVVNMYRKCGCMTLLFPNICLMISADFLIAGDNRGDH